MDQPRFEEVAAWIRGAEVGRSTLVETPFGLRPLFYADLTASGRALAFVEARVARALPLYGNVHSALSSTGRATTALREEARRTIARAVNAGPDDVVLFVGSGATAAVNKLVGLLGLRIPEPLERAYRLSRHVPAADRPVVLAGPYEHHSNELPWLESIAELVEVELSGAGTIDLHDLRAKARAFRDRPLRVGAISAASNVTGVITDVRAVCRVLHEEGAVACVDFAAAGPYLPIDMHPPEPLERIDALFLSTHKLMGGPGASGLLVAHRDLFHSRIPERPGGGTVDYVGPAAQLAAGTAPRLGLASTSPRSPLHVDYAHGLAEREEGGTPDILGDIRAGLAFAVRALAGPERILAHDLELAEQAVRRLSAHPRIKLLGPTGGPRLPILSFNVEGLHHELVAALLDHLFGVQARGGCSCAGPYGHRLLGIDEAGSERYRRLIAAGLHGVKPGWVRVSVPYAATPADVDFLLSAVEAVADLGEAFVPLYRLSWTDAAWRWAGRRDPEPPRLEAELLARLRGEAGPPEPAPPLDDDALERERARLLAEARRLAAELSERWRREPPAWNRPTGHREIDELVWFRYVDTDQPPPAR